MTLYTVHAPPAEAGREQPDATELVFIKEGFCWPALFFPEIWLIVRRQWLVLVLYVVAAVAIGLGAATIAGGLPVALILLGRVYFGLEANGLRRWTSERNGYRLIGVVEGRRLAEVERRFFADWLEATPAAPGRLPQSPAPFARQPAAPEPARPGAWKPSAEAGELVGLFPSPGGTSS